MESAQEHHMHGIIGGLRACMRQAHHMHVRRPPDSSCSREDMKLFESLEELGLRLNHKAREIQGQTRQHSRLIRSLGVKQISSA